MSQDEQTQTSVDFLSLPSNREWRLIREILFLILMLHAVGGNGPLGTESFLINVAIIIGPLGKATLPQ